MNISTHYYYIIVNIGCFIVPFLFSFHPRLRFYRHWKAFGAGTLVMAAVFIPWDMYYTAKGIWGFNDKYISGIYIGNLPLEECLFFFCIPYACIYTYHCFSIFLETRKTPRFFDYLGWGLAALCIVTAAIYHDRAYTLVTHLLCAVLLLLHLCIFKSAYLGKFLLVFMVLLVPFLASNGVLTGITFWQYPFINLDPDAIAEPIVWYDNVHNLGVRIWTMPVDDLSYGLTMLLLTVTVYERMLRK